MGTNPIPNSVLAEPCGGLLRGRRLDFVCFCFLGVWSRDYPFVQFTHFIEPELLRDRRCRNVSDLLELLRFL